MKKRIREKNRSKAASAQCLLASGFSHCLWQKFCSSSLLVNLLHFSAQSVAGRRGGDISSLGWRSSGRAWACLLSLSSRTPTDTSIGPCNRGLGATVTQEERVEDTTDRGWSLEEELSWGDLVSFTTTTPWTAFGEVNHPPPTDHLKYAPSYCARNCSHRSQMQTNEGYGTLDFVPDAGRHKNLLYGLDGVIL